MNPSIALPGPGRSRAPFESPLVCATKTQRREAQRLAALGPQHPVQAFMNIETAIRDGLKLLRATLPERIQIVVEIAEDLPAVCGDAAQIQQVLVNLGINSAQAMPAGDGTIRVSVVQVHGDVNKLTGSGGPSEGDYVWLRFSDTGCGMDAATCERIFEPFFTTKPKDVGTGLGLSVVREIITEHGGSITVQSWLGNGTEFSIYLPAGDPADDQIVSSGASSSERPVTSQGHRILFLDDDIGFVELAERVIGKAGYRVIAHFDPSVALAEFSAAPDAFDLVVVDLEMPGASGIDVARLMLAIRADIPIIITAGYVSPADEERATTCGVREVINKSATVEELCMAFGRVLGASG
jgi:two-component system cell cycle sensor histidine kinase/response regulator CckA